MKGRILYLTRKTQNKYLHATFLFRLMGTNLPKSTWKRTRAINARTPMQDWVFAVCVDLISSIKNILSVLI